MTTPPTTSTSTDPGRHGRGDTLTYAWHTVGHRISGLVYEPAPVTPDTLPLAVVAHAATVRLLTTVHHDLTDRGPRTATQARPHGAPSPLQLLEADPVTALGHALDRHPATPGAALSDVLTTNPPPGPARLWHDLARASTLAEHAWRDAEPTSRPHHDQAWSVMADVGALAESLALLDHDIAHTATRLTPTGQQLLDTSPGVLSDRYGHAATAGRRATGERTRLLAALGPLPDVGPLRHPVTTPHAPRHPTQVPTAQTATAQLLDTARTISPADLTLLALAQAKLSQHAARLSADPALLAYLRGIHATDPDAPRIAAALARSQPDLLDALHRAARDQLVTGAWLVPDDRPRTSSHWMRHPATPDSQPDLVLRLVQARGTAHTLSQTAGPTRSPTPTPPPNAKASHPAPWTPRPSRPPPNDSPPPPAAPPAPSTSSAECAPRATSRAQPDARQPGTESPATGLSGSCRRARTRLSRWRPGTPAPRRS